MEVDPFQWLEHVRGRRALKWAKRQSQRTLDAIGHPSGTPLHEDIINALEERIPTVKLVGGLLYNFWRDAQHRRGLWRRTSVEQFGRKDPAWETVLDLDALSRRESESWVWRRCTFLDIGPDAMADVCLVKLSRGRSDAVVLREFNLTSKQFVLAPFGFVLPEAEMYANYEDHDTLLVGMDTGLGSLTDSGCPRTARRWVRGTPFAQSELVSQGSPQDVRVEGRREYQSRGFVYDWRVRYSSCGARRMHVRIVKPLMYAKEQFQFQVPSSTVVHVLADQLILQVHEDFTPDPGITFSAGSVVATNFPDFLAGTRGPRAKLFQHSIGRNCVNITTARDALVLRILDVARMQLLPFWYTTSGEWVSLAVEPPCIAVLEVSAVDRLGLNQLWITSQSFLQPSVLSIANLDERGLCLRGLKFAPAMFDASGMEVSQRLAISKDGTFVPYFLVNHRGVRRPRPTILHGYGGFGACMLPDYLKTTGIAWLSQGGVYAVANIRGGGEFGPGWHQAAARAGRHRCFEDFAAVAWDLIRTGVTKPHLLGAWGSSNGGLLVGSMLVNYPLLFGAIVCDKPVLDTHRFAQLASGASWIGEYGDPLNTMERAFWDRYSPYCNINSSMSMDYPPVLFTTSRHDQRVHPAHARKMAARMQAECLSSSSNFYESAHGGHRGADLNTATFMTTLMFMFLRQALLLNGT